jgi:hypothetical protein
MGTWQSNFAQLAREKLEAIYFSDTTLSCERQHRAYTFTFSHFSLIFFYREFLSEQGQLRHGKGYSAYRENEISSERPPVSSNSTCPLKFRDREDTKGTIIYALIVSISFCH